jgi:hypothetical protein
MLKYGRAYIYIYILIVRRWIRLGLQVGVQIGLRYVPDTKGRVQIDRYGMHGSVTMSNTVTQGVVDDALAPAPQDLNDIAHLFRCAVTCKRWCRLVAEPSFLLWRR